MVGLVWEYHSGVGLLDAVLSNLFHRLLCFRVTHPSIRSFILLITLTIFLTKSHFVAANSDSAHVLAGGRHLHARAASTRL